MGTINPEKVSNFNYIMAKLQYVSLVTTLAVLGLNTANIRDTHASVKSNKHKSIAVSQAKNTWIFPTAFPTSQLAQKTSSDKDINSGDEMIDALQERQDKLENLNEIQQLNRLAKQEKILKTLQEQDFDVESVEELETIQKIVNNSKLTQEQMLNSLQEQGFNIENSKQLNQLIEITEKIPSATAKYSEPSGISSPLAFSLT